MLKRMLAVVFALTAGLTSAVTVEWNEISLKKGATTNLYYADTNEKKPVVSEQLSLRASVVLTGTFKNTNLGPLFSIGSSQANYFVINVQGANGSDFGTLSATGVGSFANKQTFVASNIQLRQNESGEMIFAYDKTAGRLEAYINGQLLARFESVDLGSQLDQLNLGTLPGGKTLAANVVDVTFDGKVHVANALIPEPTVLALLALGVAGFAMCRPTLKAV